MNKLTILLITLLVTKTFAGVAVATTANPATTVASTDTGAHPPHGDDQHPPKGGLRQHFDDALRNLCMDTDTYVNAMKNVKDAASLCAVLAPMYKAHSSCFGHIPEQLFTPPTPGSEANFCDKHAPAVVAEIKAGVAAKHDPMTIVKAVKAKLNNEQTFKVALAGTICYAAQTSGRLNNMTAEGELTAPECATMHGPHGPDGDHHGPMLGPDGKPLSWKDATKKLFRDAMGSLCMDSETYVNSMKNMGTPAELCGTIKQVAEKHTCFHHIPRELKSKAFDAQPADQEKHCNTIAPTVVATVKAGAAAKDDAEKIAMAVFKALGDNKDNFRDALAGTLCWAAFKSDRLKNAAPHGELVSPECAKIREMHHGPQGPAPGPHPVPGPNPATTATTQINAPVASGKPLRMLAKNGDDHDKDGDDHDGQEEDGDDQNDDHHRRHRGQREDRRRGDDHGDDDQGKDGHGDDDHDHKHRHHGRDGN